MSKPKVALCMRGAISKSKAFSYKNDLYNAGDYVDYKKCYRSILKHIIQPNADKYDIDIFCQSWNVDCQKDIQDLYTPKKISVENNNIYSDQINKLCKIPKDFGGISQALAIKKVIELKEEYEHEFCIKYDIVILYRYDVLLWKDIGLDNYVRDLNSIIYVNGHPGCNGDFHFIMNNHNSYLFKNLYDSILSGNNHKLHSWIKNYVINYLKLQLIMDSIIPGLHQEVIRKIMAFSINKKYLSMQQFNSM